MILALGNLVYIFVLYSKVHDVNSVGIGLNRIFLGLNFILGFSYP